MNRFQFGVNKNQKLGLPDEPNDADRRKAILIALREQFFSPGPPESIAIQRVLNSKKPPSALKWLTNA